MPVGGRADRRPLRRPRCSTSPARTQKWFTFTNGAHIDSLDPYTYDRWYDFLELYVAHQAPIENRRSFTPRPRSSTRKRWDCPKTDIVTLPSDPIQEKLTYESALAAFEALPEIRVLFDNGAGTLAARRHDGGRQSLPGIRTDASPNFPIPGTIARTWYLGPDGTLTEQPATAKGVDSYTSNANALPLTDYSTNTGSGGLWGDASEWEWNWEQNPAGLGCVLRVGTAHERHHRDRRGRRPRCGSSHQLRTSTCRRRSAKCVPTATRRSSRTAGCGRASASSRRTSNNMFEQEPTLLQPIPNVPQSTCNRCPRVGSSEVVIPLYFEGHVYRAGSRIRVTIAAPNGTQPVWSFSQTQPRGRHGERVDRVLAQQAVEPRCSRSCPA